MEPTKTTFVFEPSFGIKALSLQGKIEDTDVSMNLEDGKIHMTLDPLDDKNALEFVGRLNPRTEDGALIVDRWPEPSQVLKTTLKYFAAAMIDILLDSKRIGMLF